MHLSSAPEGEAPPRERGGEGSGRGDARVSMLLCHPVHFLPHARIPMASRAVRDLWQRGGLPMSSDRRC